VFDRRARGRRRRNEAREREREREGGVDGRLEAAKWKG